jgi:predicted nucleic acid-binding protein
LAFYLDTSALVKLVVEEPESEELRRWLAAERVVVSCDLARSELVRAVRGVAPASALAARNVLNAVELIALTQATFEEAARLDPDALRTLDALHLAAALELGDDLDAIVTYDVRLAEAAQAHGVAVVAPGAA